MKDKLPDDVKVELEHAIEAAHSNSSSQVSNSNSVEIVGTIDAISSGSITVAGRTYILDANSELKGSLKVGDVVKIHASANPDGSLVAREIEVEDHAAVTPEPGDDKGHSTGEVGDDHGNNETEIGDENSADNTEINEDNGGDGTQMEDNHGGSRDGGGHKGGK
jgi:hypothetical protein